MVRFFFILLLLLSLNAYSQHQITGRVTDSTTEDPVEFAHIYLANTTIGATSDVNGYFILNKVPDGQFDLVVTMVGYQAERKRINTLEDRLTDLQVKMEQDKKILDNVEVKDQIDRKWRRQFKQFREEILGEVPNARQCEIANPWVVEFTVEREKNFFKARAEQPLVIHNEALGYEITFLLQNFEIMNDQFFYAGYPRFEVMKTENVDSVEKFIRNREKAYKGSTRHFFFALINGRLMEEGFRIYNVTSGNFYNHPHKFNEAVQGGYLQPVEGSDFTIESTSENIMTVRCRDIIEVVYEKGEGNSSLYSDISYQISRIDFKSPVRVSLHGYVYNPLSFITYGHFAEERLANMLPYEYGTWHLNQLK